MKKLIFIIPLILVIMLGGFSAYGAEPAVKITLVLDTPVCYPEDTLNFRLTLTNENGAPIVTTKGFSETEFFLYLRFYDEVGNIIVSDKLSETNALTPETPRVFQGAGGTLIQGDLVEILPADWAVSYGPYPVNQLYPLAGRSGRFKVKAVVGMSTYPGEKVQTTLGGITYAPLNSGIPADPPLESNTVDLSLVEDVDGDTYFYPVAWGDNPEADCDDNNAAVNPGAAEILDNGIDDDCDPATADVNLIEPGYLSLTSHMHTVGLGSHPGSTKSGMAGLPVRVYDKSTGSCVSHFGVSWHHYKSIWQNCSSPDGVGLTDGDGKVAIPIPPGDYLVIARHDPDSSATGDEIYLGVSVGLVESGATVSKYLQMIVKADKKKVAAKYKIKDGSQLLIIEPEFIEWEGTQELYPFVFDSVGDWEVTTSVSPPEGFLADNNALSEEVLSEVEAVQFTITDIGSDWVSTSVVHTVKHKNKTEKIKSKIGIKLTKKLAKEKGLTIWGHEGKDPDKKEKKEKKRTDNVKKGDVKK